MKKEEWEKLEEYVTRRMQEVYGEWDASMTVGSGNKLDDGDSKSPDWIIECKHTGLTQNINILRKWLNKVTNQALRYGKEWGLVRQADDSPITITIEFDIFIELLKGEFNGRDSKSSKDISGRGGRENPHNECRREEERSEESNIEHKPETWSRNDYDRHTSGTESPHGTSGVRPPNTSIRRRKISQLWPC